MLRNMQCYRLPEGWAMSAAQLESALKKRRFAPCGSQDMDSRGWVSVRPAGGLVHTVGGQWLISMCVEKKLLPASVIKQETAERAKDLEDAQGYKLGRKQMKELKEQVTTELLPKAFVKRGHVNAWINPNEGWLVVDSSSRGRADDVLALLFDSLEDFPVRLPRTERSPASAMADWLASEEAPQGFTVDQDCELKSVAEDRASVKYARHPLEGDEIRQHLEAGKLPTQLAMTFDDKVSFVLTDKLEVKRVTLLETVLEKLEDAGAEDAEALFDAQFALATGELSLLLAALIDALGGELVED